MNTDTIDRLNTIVFIIVAYDYLVDLQVDTPIIDSKTFLSYRKSYT